MARDDLPSLAGREPATELGVELLELAGETLGRLRLPELDADRTRHGGVANRVEPHMRVANDLAVLVLPLLQILSGEQVERAAIALLHGGLEPGHESLPEIEHERRVVDRTDVARGQLEVVRLGACGREIPDGGTGDRDLLGSKRQRIEAGNDRLLALRARAAAASRCERRCRGHVLR